MRKLLSSTIVLAVLITIMLPFGVSAHSGRTDGSGGHNCSAKSVSKGLCSGYHYHNGGGSSSSSSDSSSSSSSSVTKEKVIYNESAPYPYCKKVKDVYQSSDEYYIYYERVWDCTRYTESGSVYTELDLSLYVNDTYQSLQQNFISIKNSSYIYIRDLKKAFDYELEIDDSKNVILKSTDHTIKIYAESRKIYLDGKYTGFNAVKVDGNYYLPFRASVKWAEGKIQSIDNTAVYITN
ncbi:YHYH domain-containing protein [Paenibacillus sp. NEAU-GSW1]|uniref:YHYH domain-containing protein n=1 Tax=Paenibacillus sp. NEAU-GSW1 TaxID=2682486 RepID=UPI0012E1489A|nr:YHYH domain-containing protein [Paenibacillus sp. NEAU-GSW1]MUT66846.1 YHYH domain-containing protein [Paenibacillus sp. NEAU-GSW1]